MQLHLLQSKTFIFFLFLVLVNDFILKYNFPCWLTGKLSDFAGLFVFVVFWIAFFPKKRNTIVWTTAILFTWWKSLLSQPLIEFWNEVMFYSIYRVVDYSDLMALVVLPIALSFCKKNENEIAKFRMSPSLMIGLSFFVFCSTSAIQPPFYEFPNPQIYAFQIEIDSSAVFEKEIYFGNFEKDSTNIFRLRNGDKIFYENRGYRDDKGIDQSAILGDSILLVKQIGTEYWGRHNGFNTNSGRIPFMERLRNEKEQNVENYLNQKLEILAEPAEFPFVDGQTTPYETTFKFFPIRYKLIDSTFWRTTNQFGELELFSFKKSLLDGKYVQFWDSTTAKITGFYDEGLETGTWEFFDSLGVKNREEIYQEGELIEIIHIQPDESRKVQSVVTRKKVIRIHTIFLILFIVLLLSSFYFFKKLYQPIRQIPEEKKGIQYHLFRFIGGFGCGFVVSVSVWGVLVYFFYPLKIWYWDLPIDLMLVFVFSPFLFLLSSLYFLLTNRIKDIFWITIWVVLIILIYAEIQYLFQL